jgi:hypothetical protein
LKNSVRIVFSLLLFLSTPFFSQNTFSPYSRYGLGEPLPSTLAHNAGMGGAFIALMPDSNMPIFLNTGNPASYALIRLTSLEVGGRYIYSRFSTSSNSVKKWGANFAYGALGFPVGRKGGACLGIMPYTTVGYEAESTVNDQVVGDVMYKYKGSGGLNKAFIGYGFMPFNRSLARFRRRNLNIDDSLRTLSHGQYMRREFGRKLLSDFSVGFNVNYIFGNIMNATRVQYPNSLLYNNTYRERDLTLGDFGGNFGLQTAITIDSVNGANGRRRALREKVKFTFGFFMGAATTMKASYNSVSYNYILSGQGDEIVRDTVFYNINQKTFVTLPLEQGFGIGFKKGQRISVAADFATTAWKKFKYLGAPAGLVDNSRISIGINFVPEKYAAGRGAFLKRINYRAGLSYQTGFVSIRNNVVSGYLLSAGVGLPVGIGRLSSMINISAQYGINGTTRDEMTREDFWRINFGFTFSDRWFQKFRYD